MKVLILHGTNGNSQDQWFPWIKKELERKGHQVWVPDLPGADEPDINVYNPFIIENCPFKFDQKTTIVGHSSGVAAAFGLLQVLPVRINKIISVAGFADDLDYEPVKKMFRTWNFDWEKIKRQAGKIYAVYSDDDPYVPTDRAEKLRELTGAEKIMIPGQKHFSVSSNPKYKKFPEILDLVLGY